MSKGAKYLLCSVLFAIAMLIVRQLATWFVYQHNASVIEGAAVLAAIFAVSYWIDRRSRARRLD